MLKKAHLRRWRAGYPSERWVRRCDVRSEYVSHLASRAAWHLDLFEQPGKKQFFGNVLIAEFGVRMTDSALGNRD